MRSFNVDFDLRWAREDRAERHGRSKEQARELWQQAAQSASCCGNCFRPLSPTNSVTMELRDVGRWKHPYWVRVPICLLCTLDAIALWRYPNSRESWYPSPHWHRTRCLNCERPIRVYGNSLNARTCCADCQRAVRNERNNLRRRVQHKPMTCSECGRSFLPKRSDAVTCSNACRQKFHRQRHAHNHRKMHD